MSEGPGSVDRRSVLRGGAALAGALVVGCRIGDRDARDGASRFHPDTFLSIVGDGTILLSLPKSEMGQGVFTAIAMLVAEELEVDPAAVTVDLPPGDADRFGAVTQETGGSTSMRETWMPLRQAAANARAALIAAAARRWGVRGADCHADAGIVRHAGTGRASTYGDLSADAAAAPVPKDTQLKPASAFRLIGKATRRLDARAKVDGTAVFGIDVRVPGMKIGALAQSPTFGGSLAAVDEAAAMRVAGVRAVVRMPDAVAVVADHYWAARKGLEAAAPQWEPGPNATLDQADIVAAVAHAAARPGVRATDRGDVDRASQAPGTRLHATYDQPFLAHAAMEPGNCVAHVHGGGCEIWTGTQIPGAARLQVAQTLDIPVSGVVLHNHLLGGAFGRRLEADMILRTVAVARQVPFPVKVIWSREEDVQHDLYRPYYQDRLAATLGLDGKPIVLTHRIAGASIMARLYPEADKGTDADAIDGAAAILYAVPAHRVEWARQDSPVPTSWWRGVGGLRSAFAVESFVDEMAVAAGADPVAYRRALITDARALAVLELAAVRSGWGDPLPARQGRGVALINLWGTYLAMVARVETGEGAEPRVRHVTVAVDCGQPINPAGIRAQIEGGIMFGLSGALFGEITIAGGRVQQSGYHDVRPIRMNEAPAVDTHIIASHEPPGGIGEPPCAAIGPAVVNAIHAATGQRIRRLPIVRG